MQQQPSIDGIPFRVAASVLAIPVIVMLALVALWPGSYGSAGELTLSSARLWRTLVLEVLLTAGLGTWLWSHGWRPHRTATLPWTARDVVRALGVWIGALLAYVSWAVFWYVIAPIPTTVAMSVQLQGQPSLVAVVVLSLFNAIFEEFLWLGLGIAALRRFGVAFAAVVSMTLRLLVHVYQGPLVLITVLPLGVVFTVYYLRTGRLWPIVLAHAYQDLLALGWLAMGMSARAS